MFDVKEMGKRIRELRGDVSQDKCADALGISRGALSFYENGERKPDAEIIYKMADYFNVTSDYLLGISCNKNPDEKIQAACEYTGLNEESIYKLNRIIGHKKDNENGFDLLCSIIGHPFSYLLISEIKRYSDIKKRINERHPNMSKNLKWDIPDLLGELSPEELAERDAEILLEGYGYVILQSDFEILDYCRQRISSLLIDILGE